MILLKTCHFSGKNSLVLAPVVQLNVVVQTWFVALQDPPYCTTALTVLLCSYLKSQVWTIPQTMAHIQFCGIYCVTAYATVASSSCYFRVTRLELPGNSDSISSLWYELTLKVESGLKFPSILQKKLKKPRGPTKPEGDYDNSDPNFAVWMPPKGRCISRKIGNDWDCADDGSLGWGRGYPSRFTW